MDIHVEIRGFSEIHVWICYGFSDRGWCTNCVRFNLIVLAGQQFEGIKSPCLEVASDTIVCVNATFCGYHRERIRHDAVLKGFRKAV